MSYLRLLTFLPTLSFIGFLALPESATAADGPAAVIESPTGRTILQGTATTLTFTADGTAPLTYQWRKNGLPIAGATTASYTISAALPSDEGNYSVSVSNTLGGATSAQAELLVDPGIVTGFQTNNLFGVTKAWRYNQTDDLSAINWMTNTYNDAAWSGPGGGLLYVEEATTTSPKTTALTLGRMTYYFRTEFTLAEIADVQLSSTIYVDDGAVIYLNGVPIYRIGMDEGAVNYATIANRTVGDAGPEGPFDLPADRLRSGVNVLAVEAHQVASTSSDIVWGMDLTALTPSRVSDTVRPTIQFASGATTNRVLVTFSERVEPATATNSTNYTLSGGVTISGAYFTNDNRTVALVTSTLVTDVPYLVTVNNVRDRAVTPNTILPGAQFAFSLASGAFSQQNIGNPAVPSSVVAVAGGYNITAGGTNIAGVSDQFTFNAQQVAGDFDYKVRVAGLSLADAWTKAGLMARETLLANSIYAATFATPSIAGSYFQWRATAGGATLNTGSYPVNYPNTWLRLQRVGNVFTSYASMDGNSWYQLGTASITMASGVYVGMAVSAGVPGTSATPTTTAEFRDFVSAAGGTIAVALPDVEPAGPSSRRTPIAITEIMYNPAPDANSNILEFIEIFNSNPHFEDISGYRISGDIDFIFPANTVLKGGEYRVIARNSAHISNVYGLSGVMGPYTNVLKDNGTIRLRNKEDAVLLEISYENQPPWPIAADGAGHSLVLVRPSYGEGFPQAWGISDKVGGSPGGYDGVGASPQRAVVINEVVANSELPEVDYVELFNHSNVEVDIAGCTLSDDPNTNKFVIPASTKIPARGFRVYTQGQLGFGLSSGGETVYFRSADGQRVLDAVRFGAQAANVALGRTPDGAKEIYPLATRTPGVANAAILVRDIVINEIMYNPISSNGDDEYVELFNKGASPVNLAGWRFISGIDYTFPSNSVLAANSYLVVAKNASRMLTNYPALNTNNTYGDFDGSLKSKGERVAIAMPDVSISTNGLGQIRTNKVYVVVDEVTYGVGGNWGSWANGGGSSLELIDARADHRLAHNWADSDETAKAPWTTLQATGAMDLGSGTANFFELLALNAGEWLVDNVEVIPSGGANVVSQANSDFEGGQGGWLFRGTHIQSFIENTGGFGNNGKCLHVRATARGDAIHNRCLVPITAPSGTVTLRAKVRWLRGWPEFLVRLHGNYMEATGPLLLPTNLGTPGAPNSRAIGNAPPAIYAVSHQPVVPAANQAVVVTARVQDPDGISGVAVSYRLDPSPSYATVTMTDNGTGADAVAGDGIYSGTIPGQTAGTLVAYYLQATDGAVSPATALFPRSASPTTPECLVRFGDPVVTSGFGTYRQWMTAYYYNIWNTRPALSNERLPVTFVYGNFRAFQFAAVKWAGSPYHQFAGAQPNATGHYSFDIPEDDLFLGTDNLNKVHAPGNGPFDDGNIQREQTCYWLARQLGLPWNYRRAVNMYFNGNRPGGANQLMEDTETPGNDVVNSRFPDDPDGNLYKLQPWFEVDDGTTHASALGFANVSWCDLTRYTTPSNGVPVQKLARYRNNFLARAVNGSVNDYGDVFALKDAADTGAGPNHIANMQGLCDMEQWMRTFAVHHSVGDWDHFGSRNSQNMYGYKPTKGKWQLLIWDMNIVIGNGSSAEGSNLFEITGGGPNMQKIYDAPLFRRMYLRALKELCNGAFVPANMNPMLDAKYAAYQASGVNPTPPANIKTWIANARTAILNTISPEDAPVFKITGTNVITSSNNLITITGEAPVQARTIAINGAEYPVIWTSAKAFSVQVPVGSASNLLELVCKDINDAPIAGMGTNITVIYTGEIAQPEGALTINEIMYNPVTPEASYIEIVNTANFTFDLSNWRVNGIGFTFPAGSVMTNRQYLVLAKNRSAFAAAYKTGVAPFGQFDGGLDDGGETISLQRPVSVVTTNGTTVTTNTVFVNVDRVKYDDDAPWPFGADGVGPSLQLIDASQDNSRVSNWTASENWRYVVYNGVVQGSANPSSQDTNFSIFMSTLGEVYVDDIKLVVGSVAEAGQNLIQNGDFEVPFDGIWSPVGNHGGSVISTTVSRSGTRSLRLTATGPGNPNTGGGAVRQVIPGFAANTPATLSFWFIPTTNGVTLTLRTRPSSTLNSTNPIAPVLSTPGTANSVAAPAQPYEPLWLNELQPNNLTGITDNNGQREPWIEIYNAGASTLDLSGYYLADNFGTLTQWQFPAGSTLAPGAFQIVWADGQPTQSTASEWHTSFRLNSVTGSVALVRIVLGRPQITDYLNYGGVGPDLSFGDFPNGQPFDRQNFSAVTPGASNVAKDINVFINEWMADNASAIGDPADENFEDWFEIYNAGTTPVDLGGYWLTDNLGDPTNYQIPANGQYVIPPGGFLLVWADGETNQNGSARTDLHADFSLRASGEAIGIYSPNGFTEIDSVTFTTQIADRTSGRFADGASVIYTNMTPTPRSPNTIGLANAAPTVNPIPDRTVTLGQALSFAVGATDTDFPAQSLTFSLEPGFPAGATINASSGLFSWTPSLAQAPGTNAITVRATDNGVPALSGTRSFAVTVLTPPRATVLNDGSGHIALGFGTVAGRTYRIEYKDFLTDATWQTLGSPTVAAGVSLTVNDDLGAHPQRFYRIVQVD